MSLLQQTECTHVHIDRVETDIVLKCRDCGLVFVPAGFSGQVITDVSFEGRGVNGFTIVSMPFNYVSGSEIDEPK